MNHGSHADLAGTLPDDRPLLEPSAGRSNPAGSPAMAALLPSSSSSVTLASRSALPDPDSRRYISSSCQDGRCLRATVCSISISISFMTSRLCLAKDSTDLPDSVRPCLVPVLSKTMRRLGRCERRAETLLRRCSTPYRLGPRLCRYGPTLKAGW